MSPKAFQGILWLKIPHSHVVNDDVEVGFGVVSEGEPVQASVTYAPLGMVGVIR